MPRSPQTTQIPSSRAGAGDTPALRLGARARMPRPQRAWFAPLAPPPRSPAPRCAGLARASAPQPATRRAGPSAGSARVRRFRSSGSPAPRCFRQEAERGFPRRALPGQARCRPCGSGAHGAERQGRARGAALSPSHTHSHF